MYEYHNVYGENSEELKPTEDLEEAVKNADDFKTAVYDSERKMYVYDSRKETKWNPKWLAKIIEERERSI